MTNYELMKEISELEKMLLSQAKKAAAAIMAEYPNKPLVQVAKMAVTECNADFFTSMFDGVELALWLWLQEEQKNAELVGA
jgi:hypothetical protein